MKQFKLLIVAAIFATALATPAAWACSCARESIITGPAAAAESFIGIATDRFDPDSSPPFSSADPIEWTFDVEVPLRARLADQRVVRSASEGASCGYAFDLGRRYLVNAHFSDEGELWTSICSGNQPVDSLS